MEYLPEETLLIEPGSKYVSSEKAYMVECALSTGAEGMMKGIRKLVIGIFLMNEIIIISLSFPVWC